MDVRAYLERIGYPVNAPGAMVPNLGNLRLLHSCHLYSVPYENLDIYYNKPFTLALEGIYDKVVTRKRGGYCFELNGLFCWLLRSLGYEVTELAGRFLRGETQIPMRRHRISLVRVPGEHTQYIADVGVGTVCPRFPLAFVLELAQDDLCGERYKITADPALGYIINEYNKPQNIYTPYYSFTLEPQFDVDFLTVDYYCKTAPESIFRQMIMCGIKSPEGGAYFDGHVLKLYVNGKVAERIAQDDNECFKILKEHFGIE